jgi:hypothetical protein
MHDFLTNEGMDFFVVAKYSNTIGGQIKPAVYSNHSLSYHLNFSLDGSFMLDD